MQQNSYRKCSGYSFPYTTIKNAHTHKQTILQYLFLWFLEALRGLRCSDKPLRKCSSVFAWCSDTPSRNFSEHIAELLLVNLSFRNSQFCWSDMCTLLCAGLAPWNYCQRFAQSAAPGSEKAKLWSSFSQSGSSLVSFCVHFSTIGTTLGAPGAHFLKRFKPKGAPRSISPIVYINII